MANNDYSKLPYRHVYSAGANASLQDVNDIMATFKEVAGLLGLKSIRFWTAQDNNENAVFFASDNFREKCILSLRLFGEGVGVNNYKHVQIIEAPQDVQKAWVACARGLLADQAIRHTYTHMPPNLHQFAFNKSSSLSYFSGLVYCGYIDALLRQPTLEIPYSFKDFFKPPRNTLG